VKIRIAVSIDLGVRELSLRDEQPFSHEFFVQIQESLPFIEKLSLHNREQQQNDNQQPRANNRIVRSYKILCSILYDLVRSYENRTKNRSSRTLTLSRTIRSIEDLSVW
jgi:hypothetical protein